MTSNVFHGNGILDRQAMALAFYTRFVDKYTSVSGQTWYIVCRLAVMIGSRACRRRTGEGHADMIVEHDDLSNGTRILQLQRGLLLHAQHDNILSPQTDLHVQSSEPMS